MAKITKALAKCLAPKLECGAYWYQCRDDVEAHAGDDLDCFQLDMLTDWTIAERKKLEPTFEVAA